MKYLRYLFYYFLVTSFHLLNSYQSFKENKTYYLADTILKHNQFGVELKLQPHSVIIESIDKIQPKIQYIKTSNFNKLLENNPNTFSGKYRYLYIKLLNFLSLGL